jgi:hypothetical protein
MTGPTSRSAGGHAAGGTLEADERTVEIRRHHVPPLPECHLQCRCGCTGPSVIDEHVRPAEPAGQLAKAIRAASDIGGVQTADFCPGSSPPDLSGGVIRPASSECHVMPTSIPALASATAEARPIPESGTPRPSAGAVRDRCRQVPEPGSITISPIPFCKLDGCCCRWRAGQLAKAIRVLQAREA